MSESVSTMLAWKHEIMETEAAGFGSSIELERGSLARSRLLGRTMR